jgi:acyl-CoA synthetase (AMP-forming)/AMP-acid ligase II
MSSVDDVVLTERFAGLTIASVLANRATSDSGRAYLRFHDRVLTYGGIERDAEALAAALSNLGIEASDRSRASAKSE